MRLIDAEGLFSAIGDKADDIAKAKEHAAGSWETYYEGVADGLLLAKGLIAEEGTIEIYQNEIYQNKPEIDPVHAAGGVYCRECKFAQKRGYGYLFCANGDRKYAGWCRDNEFCSRGEKREAEDDG
mgnify:CR=1 FL=1